MLVSILVKKPVKTINLICIFWQWVSEFPRIPNRFLSHEFVYDSITCIQPECNEGASTALILF